MRPAMKKRGNLTNQQSVLKVDNTNKLKKSKILIKSYKKEWELTNIKRLTTLTENPKAFWSHLETLRGKSKVTSEAPNLISALLG